MANRCLASGVLLLALLLLLFVLRLLSSSSPLLHHVVPRCSDGAVRLTNGGVPKYNSGLVEVCSGQMWGAVCDDSWNNNDAAVVCRQLGYYNSVALVDSTFYVGPPKPIFLDDVGCLGSETTLLDCQNNGIGNYDCSDSKHAGVICRNSTIVHPDVLSSATPLVVHPDVLGRSPQPVIASGSDSIYVSVKTTGKYHKSRLEPLLVTWMQTIAPWQITIVTERRAEDSILNLAKELGFNVVKADCGTGHTNQALDCKCGVEFDYFYRRRELEKQIRWYCHFDDDEYLNVPVLVEILEQYNPLEDKVYIGKKSDLRYEDVHIWSSELKNLKNYTKDTYMYATGAAYCLSSSLMTVVEPYLRGKHLQEYGVKLKLTDDMLVGAIIEAVLGYTLVRDVRFNSQSHAFDKLTPDELRKQATLSYGKNNHDKVVNIPEPSFEKAADPTRFLSLHCFLYPQTHWCSQH